jgi:hypothetical protein
VTGHSKMRGHGEKEAKLRHSRPLLEQNNRIGLGGGRDFTLVDPRNWSSGVGPGR